MDKELKEIYRDWEISARVDPSVTRQELIDSLVAYCDKQSRGAVVEELERLDFGKHFTSWGGAQGNCIPQDVINDRIKELESAPIKDSDE